MFDFFNQMLSYSFMRNAFIAGLLISLCAALIGAPLVLKRNSMIGDGLSHVAFGAFAIATALNIAPVEFALPIVIVTSFLILRLGDDSQIHGDSAIALLSAGALAIGTFVISVTPGVNVDINSYLFGSILSISGVDVVMSVVLAVIVVSLYVLAYNKIFAITFDEAFAKSIGVKVGWFNTIFAVLCSIVIVLGMRLVGALLISSLIIFPTLIAGELNHTFKGVTIGAALVSVLNSIVGLALSYALSAPAGATIVIVNLVGLMAVMTASRLVARAK